MEKVPIEKVYIAQHKSKATGEWLNYKTKSGNALHKSYGQAYRKARDGGRVITYNLVEEGVEYFEGYTE